MPKCKDREELYNGRCRVKCLPNQTRSTRSNRCIDITRFTKQTEELLKSERKRKAENDRAEEIGKFAGFAEGIAEGERERNKLLNAIIRLSLIHI